MDRQFLEFWGNFLINAAKGHKQLEDIAKWINQDFKGYDELADMFRTFYGLENVEEDTPNDTPAWENAAKDFQKSFKDYLDLMGVVTKDEHLKLVKDYKDMKKRVADQEKTIKHLRMLLDERQTIDQSEVVRSYQDLMNKQSAQFQELTKSFGRFFHNKKSDG
ncbi:MAG: hypothetical protein JSW04_10565 [Desulfobacterales bacterium]|nr:MAG: hypothetical protein JSV38_11905 [Desulfobacterales bacterium]UCD88890.1 MAG: hypothetical protein JSW04_10565 [Desulfobacterales bacterium]